MREPWQQVGDGVFVRRHERADLNVGLIVGEDACLVVDTRLSPAQGRDLAEAIRSITRAPWLVVNTHGHYDHSFGNAAFTPAEIWGHVRCADMLRRDGEIKREYFERQAVRCGDTELAAELAEVAIVPPDRTFDDTAHLMVGGREVILRHLGRGHTDNDIVVAVPGVVFAGDLVEQGAPPVFNDSFPLEWPSTVEQLAAAADATVVPGHGAVVDRAFVLDQAAVLRRTADVARATFESVPMAEAVREVPLPEPTARVALARAWRQLRGAPAYDPPADLRRFLLSSDG